MFRTLLFLQLVALAVFAGDENVKGRWETFDDETGKAKSIIRLYVEKGELKGAVDSLLPWPGKSPDRVCEECSDERKGKPIRGMTVLWGMKSHGSSWEDGRILDPGNGKIYRCKLDRKSTRLNSSH